MGSTPVLRFDGETFDASRDGARLSSQLERVQVLMTDGRWRTLASIAAAVGGSEPAVSARLRDLRKPRFGGLLVERRYVGEGLWEYRVAAPQPVGQLEMFMDGPTC